MFIDMTDWGPATTLEDMLIIDEEENLPEVFMDYSLSTDPFHGFTRIGDNSGSWHRLFQALEKQDVPGWPLLTPMLMRTQTCKTCDREFYSGINYRRHLSMHEESDIYPKKTQVKRTELALFWNTLSLGNKKKVLSFKSVTQEGNVVVNSLTSLVRTSGFSVLPQTCIRAGSAILDIIQRRESRFPIFSLDLFRILDDASENTFLCGIASKLKTTVFDPEIGRCGRPASKNIVASISFVLETKVVRAWSDSKKVIIPKIPKPPKKPNKTKKPKKK